MGKVKLNHAMYPLLIGGLTLALALAGCGEKKKEKDQGLASEQSAGQDEATAIAALEQTMHPLAVQRCSGCHGADVSPQFAHADVVTAYKQIIASGIVDFTNPSRSRPVQRLLDNHNCWSECEADSQAMQEVIAAWIAGMAVEQSDDFGRIEVGGQTMPHMASSASWIDDPESVGEEKIVRVWEAESGIRGGAMTVEDGHLVTGTLASEYTPDQALEQEGLGRATIFFDVEKAANYWFYLKVCGSGREGDSLFVRIDESQTNIWDLKTDAECTWRKLRFRQFDSNNPDNPDNFKVGTARDVRRDLEPGFHRLVIIDRSPDIRIDRMAILNSEEIELEAAEVRPSSVMVVDLSDKVGVEAHMTVPVMDRYNAAYLFLAPHIWLASGCLKVRQVRPLVNGVFLPQHSNMMGVSKIVAAPGAPLVRSGMTILKDKGPAEDSFSFSFEQLKVVDCP